MNELTVNVDKVINAPIKTVFEAWLNPTMLAKFILPMPGMPAPEVENKAEEGGNFSIVMQVGEDKIPHTGKYLVIDRYNELKFTWQSPCSADNSTVTLSFQEVEKNKTQLKLMHEKFLDEESRADHEGGWGNILDALNNIMA